MLDNDLTELRATVKELSFQVVQCSNAADRAGIGYTNAEGDTVSTAVRVAWMEQALREAREEIDRLEAMYDECC